MSGNLNYLFPSKRKGARFDVSICGDKTVAGVELKSVPLWFCGAHTAEQAQRLAEKLAEAGLTAKVKPETEHDLVIRFFDAFCAFQDLDADDGIWEIAKLVSLDDMATILEYTGIMLCPEESRRLRSYCI